MSSTVSITKQATNTTKSEKFSDVVLVVGGKEFRVDKTILAARSTVFKAMFELDCEDARQNRIEIKDLNLEAGEEFLNYLSTGNVSSLDRFAPELLAVADKFQLNELKSTCEQYLGESVNMKSMAKVLNLAHMHNAKQLQSKCLKCIFEYVKTVHHTTDDGWATLFDGTPELGFYLTVYYNVYGKSVIIGRQETSTRRSFIFYTGTNKC